MDTTYIYNPTTDTLYLMLYILGASRHEIWFALEYPDLIKQVHIDDSSFLFFLNNFIRDITFSNYKDYLTLQFFRFHCILAIKS